jgi:hypothetical protein
MTYKDFEIFEYNDTLSDSLNLLKVVNDESGWRIFLKDSTNNYIRFFPFSECHGGGQSYLINIKQYDFGDWVDLNPDFENDIKHKLLK